MLILWVPAIVQAAEPSIEARMTAAYACIHELTQSEDWVRDAPPAVAWVSRQHWCRNADPTGALSCENSSTDLLRLRIENAKEHPTVAQRMALDLTLESSRDWRVNYYGSMSRDSLALATVSVTQPGGPPLSLTNLSFQVGDRVVVAPDEFLPPERLRERFQTAEGLRDAWIRQLDQLHANVTKGLDENGFSVCPDPDAPYRYQCESTDFGSGMYDTCVRRGLSEAEIRETRTRLDTEIEASRTLMLRDFEGIHMAVTEALKSDSCWLLVDP